MGSTTRGGGRMERAEWATSSLLLVLLLAHSKEDDFTSERRPCHGPRAVGHGSRHGEDGAQDAINDEWNMLREVARRLFDQEVASYVATSIYLAGPAKPR
ncbi:hypothetical protein JDV02_004524 [Purpureocillium takamizusanense]|uniref:Uncharacterized protein n=1 Tax=Purpureocillium takamizusanense TaxID=2060973 RepID=A0A9Q8VAV4_9HYPO|nr:uncharacterized protein JDV02_004524 [Purpureocillium takamizusanense]UNI18244.1 hypothetical protein JDV02_004524 [Purpureocillium takamizusanense]